MRSRAFRALALSLSLGLPLQAQQPAPPPGFDTYVAQAAPRRSHGSSAKLVASSKRGDRKVTYLKFAVRGIPAGLLSNRAHAWPAFPVPAFADLAS